jgi:hypothetical protein
MARWDEASRAQFTATRARLAVHLATHIPRSCTHLKGHGSVKGAVRTLHRALPDAPFVARFDIASYYKTMRHDVLLDALRATGACAEDVAVVHDYLLAKTTRVRQAAGRDFRRRRLGGREVKLPPRCAQVGGFNLHAGMVIGAHNREGLERLCRYVARPPLSSKRIHIQPNGQTLIRLKRAWMDGTQHLAYSRLERNGTRRVCPNARRSNRCGDAPPTHPGVDTPCGWSCCGTALGWNAGRVFNGVNTCRSTLWASWGEGRDRRRVRGGWRGGVLGAIGADFEKCR